MTALRTDVKFEGQIALVTGATRGIGAAIAAELAARGLVVIGTATSEDGALRISAALQAVPGASPLCRGARLDVTDAAGIDGLMESILKAGGGLHVLVNNAGITRDGLAMRLRDEDWDAVLDTNLKAVCWASDRPAVMSVSINPGAMQFTVMLRLASSRARLRVMPATPALAAA